MPTAGYFFGIDFDDDGTVSDGDDIARFLSLDAIAGAEDVSARVRAQPAVTISLGRDQARELAPPRAAAMRLVLDNADELFSQENVASVLYGRMVPGRACSARAFYSGTWYDLFAGFVDIPDENPYRRKQLVGVSALDGLARLRAAKVSTAMYTSITTDTAIGHVLDAAGWPAAKRSLQTGKTTLARWWVANVDAFSAIRDLVLTEGVGALFYIDGSGNFVFEDRHYRLLTSRCTTSQATLRGATTEPIYKRYTYVGGERGIVNEATIPVRSYTVAALAAIWTGPTPVTLTPGETRTYIVSTTSDGFTAAVSPLLAATDYTLTGTALASATLNRTSGKSAILTLVAGAGSATLTGLQVRGQTVAIAEQDVSNTIATTDSQTAHGIRGLDAGYIPSWVPTVADAQDWCNATVVRYQDKVPQVSVSLTNGDGDALTQALARRLSDRVTIVNAESGLNADFLIEAVEHKIAAPNQETLFYAEKASEQVFWVLGVAGFSEMGDTTRLGY